MTALGPFTDEDTVKFEAMVKVFEDATGIDVQYEGTKEFEATIGARVDGGTRPTSSTSRSPACWANFAKSGKITDLSSVLDMAALQANYNQSWLDMATMPGRPATSWPASGSASTARAWSGIRRRPSTRPATRCRRRGTS